MYCVKQTACLHTYYIFVTFCIVLAKAENFFEETSESVHHMEAPHFSNVNIQTS